MKRFLLAVFFFPGMLWGQQVRIVPGVTLQTGADSVVVSFKVHSEDGVALHSILQSQIHIQEDGIPVPEFRFSRETSPVSERVYIVLILDVSGSMRHQGKIQNLQRASKNIVRALREQDYCSVIVFSSRPRLLTGFTNDKNVLEETIDQLTVGGATAIYDAVWEAMEQLEPQPEAFSKVILLITDGEEQGASIFGPADVLPRLHSMANLTVHVFDLNTEKPVNNLRRLSRLGSGSYIHNPKPEVVFSAFGEFLEESRKYYVVRYRTNGSSDGLRTVTVAVRTGEIEQKFETTYHPLPGQAPTMSAAMVAIGLVAASVMGTLGTMAYLRGRRKPKGSSLLGAGQGIPHEAPRMLFDIMGEVTRDEKTQAFVPENDDDAEKTVIIERTTEPLTFGHLSITSGTGERIFLEIDSPEILFGRSDRCKARLDNMEVSRLHAKLRLEPEGFVLYDLGSANGTRVNGEDVQKRVLKDGDIIEIGNNSIVFQAKNGRSEQ